MAVNRTQASWNYLLILSLSAIAAQRKILYFSIENRAGPKIISLQVIGPVVCKATDQHKTSDKR